MYLTVVDKVIEANLKKGELSFLFNLTILFHWRSIGLTLNLNERYTVFSYWFTPVPFYLIFFLLWYSSMLELLFLKIIRDRKSNRNKG